MLQCVLPSLKTTVGKSCLKTQIMHLLPHPFTQAARLLYAVLSTSSLWFLLSLVPPLYGSSSLSSLPSFSSSFHFQSSLKPALWPLAQDMAVFVWLNHCRTLWHLKLLSELLPRNIFFCFAVYSMRLGSPLTSLTFLSTQLLETISFLFHRC